MPKATRLGILGPLLAAAFILGLYHAANYLSYLHYMLDTQVGPSWTLRTWESLKVGDNESTVRSKVGPPLHTYSTGSSADDTTRMIYSLPIQRDKDYVIYEVSLNSRDRTVNVASEVSD
ncbi:MAG: hypothetical protein K1X53_08420 [Candidatus Sumerlaeaceae bacterium]|nr:hypothetical protein [Candidatus Sumerlaeaceae bacterium]